MKEGPLLVMPPVSSHVKVEPQPISARRAKNSVADLIEVAIDDVSDFINDLRERASEIADQGTGLTDKDEFLHHSWLLV